MKKSVVVLLAVCVVAPAQWLKPGDVVMQPLAEKLTAERSAGKHASEEPDANCLPQGVPKINATPVAFKIVQDPELVVVLYEAFGQYRQAFLDGRKLPEDPKVQAKPWSSTEAMHLLADTEILEFVCNENERDIRHLTAAPR